MGFTYRQGHEGRLSIEEMDNNFLYTEEQISSLTASVANLEQSIDGIITVIAGITASEAFQDATVIAGLTASVIELTANLASATASIGTLTTNLASATASIGTLNTNLASATASIGTLETNLASATASIGTLTSDVAGLTASVIDLQNAFSNINGDFNFVLLVSGVTQSGTFSFTNGILGTYSI
jgi:prefoldin subunit 5